MILEKEQLERYKRNILLKEVGATGQAKLLASKVLIIGVGGLGSPVSLYLAAAGIGTIGLVDFDSVDLSNLQRQVIHSTEKIGIKKVESACQAIKALNRDVDVKTYPFRLEAESAKELVTEYDIVINCIDNFQTRFLLNDACVLAGKPMVEAGIMGWDGMLLTVIPGQSPCYRCLFPEPPKKGVFPTPSEIGLFGVLPGVMGVLQATEALKIILGIGKNLAGKMLLFNALETKFQEIEVEKNEHCPVCGKEPTITSLSQENYALMV